MGLFGQRSSLAIVHHEPEDEDGVTFRYTMWVKSNERGFPFENDTYISFFVDIFAVTAVTPLADLPPPSIGDVTTKASERRR